MQQADYRLRSQPRLSSPLQQRGWHQASWWYKFGYCWVVFMVMVLGVKGYLNVDVDDIPR